MKFKNAIMILCKRSIFILMGIISIEAQKNLIKKLIIKNFAGGFVRNTILKLYTYSLDLCQRELGFMNIYKNVAMSWSLNKQYLWEKK